MEVIFARTRFPDRAEKVLFLAGPTPRDASAVSWRWEALKLLKEKLLFDGTVFVPEDQNGGMSGGYDEQVEWERRALHRSDVVVFWVPRNMKTMPGLTTNDEFGTFKGRTRIVFGAPDDAEKVRYQKSYCAKLNIPCFNNLHETLVEAVRLIGPGALRLASDVLIPAHVFATEAFANWKSLVKENKLLDAEVRDLVMVGNQAFMFVLWVKMSITSENNRIKDNEVVVARARISSIVVFCRPANGGDLMDTEVVLVKEFRSASGHVIELPGGSVMDSSLSAAEVALEECREEIGFVASADHLIDLGVPRGAAPTLASHRVAAFAVETSAERMEQFKKETRSFGKEEDTERTFVVVKSIRQCFAEPDVCWTTLGILSTLMQKIK